MAKASVDVFINGNMAKASLRDLKLTATQLRNELARVEQTSADFAEKSKKLQQVTGQIDKINASLKPTKGLFSSIGKELKAFSTIAVAAFGFDFITSQISNLIQKNAKLSDSLADIQKTTGMSSYEVSKLNEQLSKIDTRSSTSELREMAAVAGQLGIASNQVLPFVTSMDKLKVALLSDFGGSTEQLTSEIGGLRNVMVDIKSENVANDLLYIGNAINVLGAEGAATAPVISDFTNRIGGVAIPMGFTSGQVLGLSATLQELNVTAERGGTAVVKLLQKMSSNVDTFANIAGVGVTEFKTMLDTDLYGAFVKVAEGSTKSAGSATLLSQMLSDAELSGAGVAEIFSKLGANTELLNKRVETATTSLFSMESIMDEFFVKNENLAAKLERVQKSLIGAFSNPAIVKWLENVVDLIDRWTRIDIAENIENERISLLVTQQVINDSNTSQEKRIQLIKDLKDQYPGYLKGIDAEKVSNAELNKSIENVNSSLLNQVIIKRQAAKLNEKKAIADEFANYLLDKEESLRKSIIQAEEKYGVKISENTSLLQKAKEAQDQLKQSADSRSGDFDKGKAVLLSNILSNVYGYQTYLSQFSTQNAIYLKEVENLKKIQSEYDQVFKSKDDAKIDGKGKGEASYKSLGDDKATEKAAAKKAKAEAKALKDSEKRTQKYLDEIRSIEDRAVDEYNASIADKYDRERAQAATIADREVEEARRRISDRKLLSMVESEAMQKYKRKLDEIAADEKGYHAERQQELLQELNTELANEAALEVATAERRKAQATTAQEYNAAEADLFKGRMKQLTTEYATRLEAAKDDVEQQKILHENFLRDKANLTNEYYDNVKNQAENTYKAEVEAAVQAANDIANVFFMMLDAIANQQQADYNNSMNELKRVKNAELKHLKDSLDSKTISEEKYNAEKDRIEKEYAMKQYQMEVALFEKRQQMARIEALIKGALLAMDLSIKFTPVVGIALAAITTGSQLALIDSQAPPDPPAFALGGATKSIPGIAETGGSIAKGGMVSKPYYALVGEKGAEYIVPNHLLTEPLVADSVRMIEAFRKGSSSGKMKAFADGGSTVKLPPRPNTSSLDSAMLAELQAIKLLLQNHHGKEVVLSYQSIAKFQDDALEARYPKGILIRNGSINPRINGTA